MKKITSMLITLTLLCASGALADNLIYNYAESVVSTGNGTSTRQTARAYYVDDMAGNLNALVYLTVNGAKYYFVKSVTDAFSFEVSGAGGASYRVIAAGLNNLSADGLSGDLKAAFAKGKQSINKISSTATQLIPRSITGISKIVRDGVIMEEVSISVFNSKETILANDAHLTQQEILNQLTAKLQAKGYVLLPL